MLPAHRVIGHKEYGNTPPGGWPGRKTDPVYDMDGRRAAVANFQPHQEDDMTPELIATINRMAEALQVQAPGPVTPVPINVWSDQNDNPVMLERNSGKPRTAREAVGDIYVHTVTLQNQIAILTAAVSTLAAGAAGEGTTAEELRAVIHEEMAKVEVQVTFNGAKLS